MKLLERIIAALKKMNLDYTGDVTPSGVKAFLLEHSIKELKVGKDGKAVPLDELFQTKTVVVEHISDGADALVIASASESAPGALTVDDEEEKKADDEDEMDEKKSARTSRLQSKVSDRRASRVMASMTKGGSSNATHKKYNERSKLTAAGVISSSSRRAANFEDAETAEAFGAWARSSIMASFGKSYSQYENDMAILSTKAQAINDIALGGALVPEEFLPTLIDLREQFGIFRRFTEVTNMSRDTLTIPRRTQDVTVYQPGENNTITESEMKFDNVVLVAKQWLALSRSSLELLEDSAIGIADTLAFNMARAFERKTDEVAFAGDGTSTFFGTQGIKGALLAVDGTIGNIAGLTQGGSNTDDDWTTFTLPNFEEMVGNLPDYADGPNTRWFCHRKFYHSVMRNLSLNQGGVDLLQTEAGTPRQPFFLGYPVEFVQSTTAFTNSSAPGTDEIVCVFGDLAMGSKLGDRNDFRIDASEQRYFDQAQIGYRALQRQAINVHDVGDTSEAGPIVGLITSSS